MSARELRSFGVTFPAVTLQVVQLVEPSTAHPHWCVNGAGYGVDGQGHLLLYVRDVGNGKTSLDELSFSGGTPSSDCLVTPDPVDEVFTPVAFGDYTGKVRT